MSLHFFGQLCIRPNSLRLGPVAFRVKEKRKMIQSDFFERAFSPHKRQLLAFRQIQKSVPTIPK